MPLYTYKCEDCGLEMDKAFHVNNFPREVKCIACGRTAKKILSPTAQTYCHHLSLSGVVE